MAFLPPQDQNNEAPTGVTSNNPGGAGSPPPQSGGSSGTGGAGSKPGATSTSGTPTQFGSSASKLGDYLTANAPQITQQANGIAGNLNNQYGQVSGDINNAANNFGQSVAAGYVAPNQDIVNQAAANPTGFVSSDPNNVNAFQAQYNDQYTGPQNFESTTPYGQIQSEVSNAVQNAGSLGTQAGLQNYFANTGGNQTQASNTLDALLVQGNPQAQQTVQTAANQFNQLNPQLQTATTGADAGVTAAQQAAANASQYAQNTINPVVSNFQNTLNSNLTNTNNQRDTYNQAVTQDQSQAIAAQEALNNAYPQYLNTAQGPAHNIGNPAADQAEENAIASLFAPGNTAALNSLAPYLSGQPITSPGTLANVSTTGQYGEDAALAQLLGSNYSPVLNPANIGQAGSYSVPNTPAALPNTGSQVQYEQDLADLYGNPNTFSNILSANNGNYQNQTPAQLAQYDVANAGKPGGQFGPGLSATDKAALERLINGEQGFQG